MPMASRALKSAVGKRWSVSSSAVSGGGCYVHELYCYHQKAESPLFNFVFSGVNYIMANGKSLPDSQPSNTHWTKTVNKIEDVVRQQKNKVATPLAQYALDQAVVPNGTLPRLYTKESPITALTFEDALVMTTCRLLAQKLEHALREAKYKYLQCSEVLVPCDLTLRVAQDVLHMAENEPCGLRGCVVYVNLEEKNLCRKIGKVKCDPDTVATFEVVLNLRQERTGWLTIGHLIPAKLLKTLSRNSPIVISNSYTLNKKKLYRSSSFP